jgi:hypothetical protein
VREWIAEHVEVSGEIEQPHVRGWATALRVPTPAGPVWFKAARGGFEHEARVLELIGPLAPELLPEVIASRPETGWLLLADAGVRAREHPLDWAPALRRYAELQIDSAPLVDALVAAGVPDNRSAAIPERLDALYPWLSAEAAAGLRARLPEIEAACAELASSPLPPMLDHGDLHDANVFVRDGRVRILDWGDCAVGHPFLSLTVESDPAARGHYLQPFGALVSQAQIERDVELVLFLRFLLRGLNWERAAVLDPSVMQELEDRVGRFLAGS